MKRGARIFLLMFIIISTLFLYNAYSESMDIENYYKEKFEEWKIYIGKHPDIMIQSNPAAYIKNDAFNSVIEIGVKIIPILIEDMEKNQDNSFYVACFIKPALRIIIKRNFHSRKYYIKYDELWIYWFYKGHKETPKLFEKYYKLYREIENTNSESIKKKEFYYNRIKDLGIEIIPLIIDKLKSKEYDLLPLLEYLTDNAISNQELKTDLDSKQKADIWIEWYENNKKDWIIPFENNLGFSKRIKIIKLETNEK